jgi:hypothetical protein
MSINDEGPNLKSRWFLQPLRAVTTCYCSVNSYFQPHNLLNLFYLVCRYIPRYVGTHKDRRYVENEAYVATPTIKKSKEIVPIVVGKDTMTVSLCTTVGCTGGRKDPDLCAPVKSRSYVCVLKG